MTLHLITVYHNEDSRFMPYTDGQRLAAAVSHWRDLPATTRPEDLADWTFHLFNIDLDQLEQERDSPDGELAFLVGCVYRLLRYRSLSVGDVVQIATNRGTCWLACEAAGWRHINPPSNVTGQPLTAAKVYHHLHQQRGTP